MPKVKESLRSVYHAKVVKKLVTVHRFGGSEVQRNKVTLPEAGKPESRFQRETCEHLLIY